MASEFLPVFTREVTFNGLVYPIGALVPRDIMTREKEARMRDHRWIGNEPVEDVTALPQPHVPLVIVPPQHLVTAEKAVTHAEAQLESAQATLERLQLMTEAPRPVGTGDAETDDTQADTQADMQPDTEALEAREDSTLANQKVPTGI